MLIDCTLIVDFSDWSFIILKPKLKKWYQTAELLGENNICKSVTDIQICDVPNLAEV